MAERRQSVYSREFPEDLEITQDLVEETSSLGRQRGMPQVYQPRQEELEAQEKRLSELPDFDIDYPKLTSDSFDQRLQKGEREFAIKIARQVKRRNPELFGKDEDPYRSIHLGRASFQAGSSHAGKRLTDREIIEAYVRNPDNEPVRMGSIKEGAITGTVEGVGSLTGFGLGAAVGGMAQNLIPPAHPALFALKFAIPIAGGIYGSVGGESAARKLRAWGEGLASGDSGAQDLVAPGRGRGLERTGETLGMGLSFIPLPWLAPREVSFGTAKYLNNLQAQRNEIAKKYQPLINEADTPENRQLLKEAVANAPKDPRIVKFIRGAEEAVEQIARRARDTTRKPGRLLSDRGQTLLEEASFVGASTAGRFVAEGDEGTSEGVGLAAELGAGLGGVYLASRLAAVPEIVFETIPAAYEFLKRKFNILFRGKDPNDYPPTLREQIRAANFIVTKLSEEGVTDQERVALSRELLKIFTDEEGQIKLTAGQLSGLPALQKIEAEIAKLFPEFGLAADKELQRIINQNFGTLAFVNQSDDAGVQTMQALRELTEISRDAIELQLNNELIDSATKAMEAWNKVGSQDPIQLADMLRNLAIQGEKLARRREKSLYANLPVYEIDSYATKDGASRQLPNIFDWVEDLSVTRTGVKFAPTQIKQGVEFIKEILQDAGIDTSQLGKRGSTRENPTAPQERLIRDLDLETQELLTTVFNPEQRAAVESLNSSSANFLDLNTDEKLEVLSAEKDQIDQTIDAIREGATGPLGQRQLSQVRKVIANRISRLRAETAIEHIRGRTTEPPSPDDQLVDEIIDLQALVNELRDLGTPIRISSAKLTRQRSDLQSAKSDLKAGATPNKKAAGKLQQLVNLIDDDLFNAAETLPSEARAAILSARAYSRALNNTFFKSQANQLFTKDKLGRYAVPDESLVDELFAQGKSGTLLRNARDIQNIGSFLNTNVPTGAGRTSLIPEIESDRVASLDIANDINSVLHKIILSGREVALKPRFEAGVNVTAENLAEVGDGLKALNMNALRTWLQNPRIKEMLSLFPDSLTEELGRAESAIELFRTAELQHARKVKEADNVLVYKRILGAEDETPDVLVARILASPKPTKEFADTFRAFEQAKAEVGSGITPTEFKQAQTALRDAFIRYAVNSGSTKNSLNPGAIKQALFNPIPGVAAKTSLVDFMVQYDLIDNAAKKDLLRTLDQLIRFDSIGSQRSLAELERSADPTLASQFVLGAVGSRLASKLNRSLGGPAGGESIMVATGGANIMRKLFSRESQVLNTDALYYLLQNPDKLAKFVGRNKEDLRTAKGFGEALKLFFMKAGFNVSRRAFVAQKAEAEKQTEQRAKKAPAAQRRRGVQGGAESLSPKEFRRQKREQEEQPENAVSNIIEEAPAVETPAGGFSEQEIAAVESVLSSDPNLESELAAAQVEAMSPTEQPAPDPVMARLAQRPTNLSLPEPRGIPLDTRRDFERMEGQLAGVGRVPAQQLGALTIDQQLDAPLSIKNNNPGNLRMAGQPGAEEGLEGFASFSTPGQGLNALTRQIVLDTQTRGLTLGEFITKYAPPSENDTEGYIRFMEQRTGVPRNRKVPEFLVRDIARAIVEFEGGKLALRYFFGDEMRAEREEVTPPPVAQAPTPPPTPPPVAARATPQSIQRAARILGPQDDIGMLASEMMMRDRPA